MGYLLKCPAVRGVVLEVKYKQCHPRAHDLTGRPPPLSVAARWTPRGQSTGVMKRSLLRRSRGSRPLPCHLPLHPQAAGLPATEEVTTPDKGGGRGQETHEAETKLEELRGRGK